MRVIIIHLYKVKIFLKKPINSIALNDFTTGIYVAKYLDGRGTTFLIR